MANYTFRTKNSSGHIEANSKEEASILLNQENDPEETNEILYPAGIEPTENKIAANAEDEQIKHLQEVADKNDVLLPTELNGSITSRKVADDNKDENFLMPTNTTFE